MTNLEVLTGLIKKFEGCELKAYKDAGGVWTCGWGCTGDDIKEGTEWSQATADAKMKTRAVQAMSSALKASPVLKNDQEYKLAAIADFIYNLGIHAYQKSSLKVFVDEGHWEHAKMEILKWNHCKGRVLAGLTRRRQAEADLL